MKTRISRRDFLKASAFAGTALCLGMKKSNPVIIDSSIGKQTIDQSGSAIGMVRMEVDKSYSGIGGLLQEHLNNSNAGAWEKIRTKIDYTYRNIDLALAPLEAETGFRKEIQSRVEKGQKLLFKPNLVNIRCINPETNSPDTGTTACTEAKIPNVEATSDPDKILTAIFSDGKEVWTAL